MNKDIYVVTEYVLDNSTMIVELFKNENDARQYIDTIISEYGVDEVTYDNDNWYDAELNFFDITLTKKQVNF